MCILNLILIFNLILMLILILNVIVILILIVISKLMHFPILSFILSFPLVLFASCAATRFPSVSGRYGWMGRRSDLLCVGPDFVC